MLRTNRFVLAQNWSLSWSKLAQWKPGLSAAVFSQRTSIVIRNRSSFDGSTLTALKSVSWTSAEFHFNRGLQRPYTGTCTILQKPFNRFLCLLIVFLKSKIDQLNFERRD